VLLNFKIFAARANFPVIWNSRTRGFVPRQGAKHAKFGGKRGIIFGKFSPLFSDLCGLCVFAGDIPILLVAALPR
jgi:hypothetical protein